MTFAARLLTLLAVIFLLGGCAFFRSGPPEPAITSRPPAHTPEPLAPGTLFPSHNLPVGRLLAVDTARGFAFVELATDAPAAALTDGAALVSRSAALRETARLESSRYVRGRTLGVKIVSGQPAPGDEVVFPAP